MIEDGYAESITYTFECGGEEWEVTDIQDDYMAVGETRKNGQEDCHIALMFLLKDGKWEFEDDEWTRKDLKTYRYEALADELLAFVNKHGRPGRDDD